MADFSLVPRSAWQDPALPVTGPSPVLDDIEDFIVHYMGSDLSDLDIDNDGDIDRNDTFAMLRGIQRSYKNTRGYSIGYNFGSGFEGNGVEIRGLSLKNAANVGSQLKTGHENHNQFSVSHLILGDIDDDITNAQKDSTALTLLHVEEALDRELNIKGHRNVDGTSCPGDRIYGWVPNLRQHALDLLDDELQHDVDVFKPGQGSYGMWLVRIAFGLDGMPRLSKNMPCTLDQVTAVRFLKGYLHNELGYDIIPKADGVYGRKARVAVNRFKKRLHLETNGVVDRGVWKAIGQDARQRGL